MSYTVCPNCMSNMMLDKDYDNEYDTLQIWYCRTCKEYHGHWDKEGKNGGLI